MILGPSGFHNAPISKGLCLLVTALSVLFFQLDSTVGVRTKFLRLLLHPVLFSYPSELIIGLIILYLFRQFERIMGSRKFGNTLFSTTIVSSLLQAACVVALPRLPSLSGPYSIIFGLFAYFLKEIPVSMRFRIFGIAFSDKSLVYLLGAQLILMRYPRALVSAMCGLLGGIASRSDMPPFSYLVLPAFVHNFCHRFLNPILQSGPPRQERRPRASQPAAPQQNIQGQGYQDQLIPGFGFGGGVPREQMAATTAATMVTPRSDHLDTLVEMGFSREAASDALVRANNNLEAASNMLLS